MNHWRGIKRLLRVLFAPLFWLSERADSALWEVMERGAEWDYAHGYYVVLSADEFIASLGKEGDE